MPSLALGLRVFAVLEIVATVLWATLLILMSGMDHSTNGGATVRLGGFACLGFAALGVLLVIQPDRKEWWWPKACLMLWCAIPVIFGILMSDNRDFPPGWGI